LTKSQMASHRNASELPPHVEGAAPDIHENQICRMCGQSGAWHKKNSTEHDFDPEDAPPPKRGKPDPLESSKARRERESKEAARVAQAKAAATRGSAEYRRRSVPTDPALRLLLVQKGVVTAEELAATDRLLESLTGEAGAVEAVRATPGKPIETTRDVGEWAQPDEIQHKSPEKA